MILQHSSRIRHRGQVDVGTVVGQVMAEKLPPVSHFGTRVKMRHACGIGVENISCVRLLF